MSVASVKNALCVGHTILFLLLSLSFSFPFLQKRLSCRTSSTYHSYRSSIASNSLCLFFLRFKIAACHLSFSLLVISSPFSAIISLVRFLPRTQCDHLFLSITQPFLSPLSLSSARAPHEEARSTASRAERAIQVQ